MATEYRSFRPDAAKPLGAQAEGRSLVVEKVGIGGIPMSDNPRYIAAVEQRIHLEAAATSLSKLYEQLGVDPDSIKRAYHEQTEGTENSPLLSSGAWQTIAVGGINTEVDLGLEDGYKVYERRRSEGKVVFRDNPFTGNRRST